MTQSSRIRSTLFVAIALSILAADQISKTWVTRALPLGVAVPVIPPVLFWFRTFNTGVAWSLFPGHTGFFSIVAALFVVGILALGRRAMERSRLLTVAMGLLLGGSVGNLLDRLRYHFVIDFIDVHLGGWYRWPTFNVADSAISVGMVMLAFFFFFLDNGETQESESVGQVNPGTIAPSPAVSDSSEPSQTAEAVPPQLAAATRRPN